MTVDENLTMEGRRMRCRIVEKKQRQKGRMIIMYNRRIWVDKKNKYERKRRRRI